MKNKITNGVPTSVISLILGIVLIIWAEQVANFICFAFGGVFIIAGAFLAFQYIKNNVTRDLHKKELISGVVLIVIGIAIIICTEIIQSIIPLILGFVVLFSGISKIQNALYLKKAGQSKWGIILFFALINIFFALALITRPTMFNDMLFVIIGISLVYSGISDLITSGVVSKENIID